MDCNRARTERLTLRMSTEEKEFLLRQKEKSKCGTFIEFILKAVSETNITVLDTTPLLEVAGELNKIGVNINQIAKIANSTGIVSSDRMNIIRNEIDRISFMVDHLIETYTKE